jgi:decaprenyl-phosphate phosphoribosyltransferase
MLSKNALFSDLSQPGWPIAGLRLYLRVARPTHWFKNLFMLAGTAAALVFAHRAPTWKDVLSTSLAFALTCCVASANYILNEILDAPTDRMHPTKKNRSVARGNVSVPVLAVLAVGLASVGLFLAHIIFSPAFLISLAALYIMGFLYNVRPIRTKDIPYLDVISEAVNNPIRLFIGWLTVENHTLPPVSLVLCYWALGAFLMSAKRYAEYRFIGDASIAERYRKSFKYYSEEKLLISMIVYISIFSTFFGVLAEKYKMELLITLPLVSGFIGWFFHLAFQEDSVEEPEEIIRHRSFLIYTLVVVVVCIAVAILNIPVLGL